MSSFRYLGSLYLNGKALTLDVSSNGEPAQYNGGAIAIGNTAPGNELGWVPWNGLLVASRCVLLNISWDELNKFGYIFGKPVEIDGQNYLCRSLKVGTGQFSLSEWDEMMDDLSKSNALWNWRDYSTFGQETATAGEEYRVIRGYTSARHRSYIRADAPRRSIGFRPVLDPLGPRDIDPKSLVGRKIKVWGPNWASAEGLLAEASDYDLVLDTPAAQINTRGWSIMDGGKTILDRSCVQWLKEAKG